MATTNQTSMNLKHSNVAHSIDALSRGGRVSAPAFFAGREESGCPPGF